MKFLTEIWIITFCNVQLSFNISRIFHDEVMRSLRKGLGSYSILSSLCLFTARHICKAHSYVAKCAQVEASRSLPVSVHQPRFNGFTPQSWLLARSFFSLANGDAMRVSRRDARTPIVKCQSHDRLIRKIALNNKCDMSKQNCEILGHCMIK